MVVQRDAKGDPGTVRAEDGLALPPELGAAAGPLGKPSVCEPDQLAPTCERCAMVSQNGEGALDERDRHTNFNLGPLRGGRCRSLTSHPPARLAHQMGTRGAAASAD